MKPQVLQFLLDLVEVHSADASTNGSDCASTLFDDRRLDMMAINDKTIHCVTNCTSLARDQLRTATDQRSEDSTSKSADAEGDSRESNPNNAGRNGIDRDRALSGKELDVQITPDDVTACGLMGITGNDCYATKSDDDKQHDFTSPCSSECELKPTVHNRCSAETSAASSKANSHQRRCCESEDNFSFALEGSSCRQCCVKFDSGTEQEEHVCGRTVASDSQTLERQQTSLMFKNPCNTKTEQHSEDDISVHEDVGDNSDREFALSTTPVAKDVTWNTLIGTESPKQHLLSRDAQRTIKFQEYDCSSSEMSTPVQPVINDHASRNRTVSSSSDSNRERHVVSPASLSDYSVTPLFSNTWNALLLHIGLECVNSFNRSLLRSDCGSDFQIESSTSKSDKNEGLCVEEVDDPRTISDDDAEDNMTYDDAERFAGGHTLQTHLERTHCQQSDGFHSPPDQHPESVISGSGLSGVPADSPSLGSVVPGHATSAAGAWNRPPDSLSSYFGGISPEILGLLSAVPPELMLPHVYPGGILPPAMMMMMMASPFIDCPSSPLPNSLAALTDPHACLLPSSATESRVTYDDAASVHQQSKRARTRISDSQLAVLRARFDINGPPNDDDIAAIGFEIGLPPKVVKHWFRNTLFKERQRSKDSPYNFSVPPACDSHSVSVAAENAAEAATTEVGRQSVDEDKDYKWHDIRSDSSLMSTPVTNGSASSPGLCSSAAQCITAAAATEAPYFPHGCYFGIPYHPTPQTLPLLPSIASVPPTTVSGAQIAGMTPTSTGMTAHQPPSTTQSRGGHGKRASRTHFSDEQVRTLQEHFERNAYPRDDELESLSRRLGLSARVIVVWFQNARQKARRTYENHSSTAGGNAALSGASKSDDGVGGPRYDCRSCGAAFQRYYELIKHQRSHVGCGSIVPTTSTSKYSAQLPDAASVASARHDNSQLRYDKAPSSDAATATAASPSSRQHYNYRHHQPSHQRVEAWYRSPVEGYVGAVSPRCPEVVNALPVQHALPTILHPHLPLMTPWNSAAGCKGEIASYNASLGVDMTAGRRQTDLTDNLADKKCEMKFLVDYGLRDEAAKSATADLADSSEQSAVRRDDDHKPFQKDCTAQRSPELPLYSTEQTSYCNTDDKQRGLAEVMSSHPYHQIMASPTAPSSAALMFSDSSSDQHGRQLLGGGEVVARSLSSPRRCYDVQRSAVCLDAQLFGLSATAGEDDSPLDLSCQGKTTSTWSAGDGSGEGSRETAVADELSQVGPAVSAADGGSLGGSGTASKSQQSGGGSSKRHRTHMSDLQVRVMRAIYAEHRTPSIGECATLGVKIGLARRVVQVWFQNARAKDKKRCLTEGAFDDGSGPGDSDGVMATGDGRCRWCGVTYAVERCSVREHVFSPEHVAAVDRIVRASTDAERRGGGSGGRAGKRDHRRRLLHRSLTSNSPAAGLQVSSTTMSASSATSSVPREFVYIYVVSLQFCAV